MSSRLMRGRRLDKITQEVRVLKKLIHLIVFVLVMVICGALIYSPIIFFDSFTKQIEFSCIGGAVAFALEEFANFKLEKFFPND